MNSLWVGVAGAYAHKPPRRGGSLDMEGYAKAQGLEELGERIVACMRCPRLGAHIRHVASVKIRRFRDWDYWGRPLPGFGDPEASLLIVGLAPAAHGGNRTGRMFTGDSSGDWLARALFEAGFANQPVSSSVDDGFRLKSTYITAVVRCAPPGNRPMREEIANCSSYLAEELRLLKHVRVVLALGRLAFDSYLAQVAHELRSGKKPIFRHGAIYELSPRLPKLVVSYHPSRQNTQTGRLTWAMWMRVFRDIRPLLIEGAADTP